MDKTPKYINPLIIRDGCKANAEQITSDIASYQDRFCPNFKVKSSGSTTETTVEVKVDDIPLIHMSTDFVPAVHLPFWPHQASSWITRRHLWPPQDTIQSIVDKGCQVVPRSSPGGDANSEWRLSFSGPEAILAQERTQDQQRAYYFFKMFFYGYLKCVESSEPEGKQLYSYIIKTTMLWAYEELPPEDPIWASLETSTQMLLFKLLGSLETGFLSHYFIPEINLLERVGEDVKIKCAEIIHRWQNNILITAPFDMPEKRKFLNFVGTLFQFCQMHPKFGLPENLADIFNSPKVNTHPQTNS